MQTLWQISMPATMPELMKDSKGDVPPEVLHWRIWRIFSFMDSKIKKPILVSGTDGVGDVNACAIMMQRATKVGRPLPCPSTTCSYRVRNLCFSLEYTLPVGKLIRPGRYHHQGRVYAPQDRAVCALPSAVKPLKWPVLKKKTTKTLPGFGVGIVVSGWQNASPGNGAGWRRAHWLAQASIPTASHWYAKSFLNGRI